MSVWDGIKQTVAGAAPLLGSALGGPAGGAVGSMIASALGTEDDPEAIQAALDDPEAAAKLKALEQEHQRELRRMMLEAETQRLTQVSETMRAEYAQEDRYVKRWRPTFGYAMCLTWTVQVIGSVAGIVYAVVANPENAGDILTAIGDANAATVPMWSVALAVIGVSVHQRSRDKQVAAGQSPGGMVQAIAGRLAGKG